MPVGFRLGTYAGGLGGLQYLENLGISVPPFPAPFRRWAAIYFVGNGASYGDGNPECEWRFVHLKMSEMAVVLGYIGDGNQSNQVSMSTKDDLDAWLDFTAWLHRPEYPDQGDRKPGSYWTDVVFRFTGLESL